jgi:hypothetical protein
MPSLEYWASIPADVLRVNDKPQAAIRKVLSYGSKQRRMSKKGDLEQEMTTQSRAARAKG